MEAYAHVGITIPRTTYEQCKVYILAKGAKLEAGDLLFIAGSDGTAAEPGHVMIFMEDGWVFQAPFTGEPVGRYAYDTTQYIVATRPALALVPAPVVSPPPTQAELDAHHMVHLPDAAAADLARKNGWAIRYWIHERFLTAPPGYPTAGLPQYAHVGYDKPRPRLAGKRGSRIGELHFPELELHKFKTTALPPLAPTGDVRHGLLGQNLGMLGNDEYGDCGPAATEHIRMIQAAISTTDGKTLYEEGFRVPHTAYTEGLYFAYGRAMGEQGLHPDQGVSNATWLLWLYQQKIIEFFAEVNVVAGVINGDNAAARAHRAMLEFHGCLVAVSLTDDAEQLFQEGLPWTTANGETPDPNEGHDIALAAYSAAGDTFATWGAWQDATIDWDNECIGECWVVGTKALASEAGYDVAAVTAVLDTLTDIHLPTAA
jgi:hypothetical protein